MTAPWLATASRDQKTMVGDPLLGFQFLLTIDGAQKIEGYFMEVTGIGSEHEVVEQKVVDKAGHELVLKQPGRLKWTDVTLKRGITGDTQIWAWRERVVKGEIESVRAAATITMLDRTYQPVAIWHFANAWPAKVTGPSLKSDGNDFGVEEVTLVHEGMYREK
jgi:phage tail-like protein